MNGNFHGREVNQKANKIAEPKKRLLLILILINCWGAKYFEVNPKKTNPKKVT